MIILHNDYSAYDSIGDLVYYECYICESYRIYFKYCFLFVSNIETHWSLECGNHVIEGMLS